MMRPHLKTVKSIDVTNIALAYSANGSKGGTVSTLNEAEYFFEHGLCDLLYAVCITPAKFDRVGALLSQGCLLTIITDSVEVGEALVSYTDQHKCKFHVMIEIDSGEHRTGLLPDDPALISLAQRFHGAAYIDFVGVLTHGGHGYGARDKEDLIKIAEQERSAVVAAAQRVRAAGVSVPVVSLGSTPTVTHARGFDAITEARPGVYLFGDLFQASIGACNINDIAVSVLASVTSHDRANDTLMLDAGALALSKDRSTAKSAIDYGFGLVCDLAGRPFASTMIVADVHQEHGQVRALNGTMDYEALPIGAMVRILPNHACMTSAMYDRYHVVTGNEAGGQVPQIAEIWHRTNGW